MEHKGRVRVLAIDDDSSDRITAERLSRHGIDCNSIQPPPIGDIADKVLKPIQQGLYDIVLLDFRLDAESSPTDAPVTYRGGTLAAAIKEQFPDVPLVLMTTEEKHQEYVRGNPQIGSLFDHLLLKSSITGSMEARRKAAADLEDLATGCRRVGEVVRRSRAKDPWRPLQKLLSIDEAEAEGLKDRLGGTVPEKPAEIVGWLLQDLLAHPGPLLDVGEASSRLGLTVRSFENDKVQKWVKPAKYEGVFCTLHLRWWETRLLELLNNTMETQSAGTARRGRADAIAEACDASGLQPAECEYCGSRLVQRICWICGKPVDAHHNLVVQVDRRPVWALRAVVCFRCIQTGRDEENPAIRFGPGTQSLVDRLRAGLESNGR